MALGDGCQSGNSFRVAVQEGPEREGHNGSSFLKVFGVGSSRGGAFHTESTPRFLHFHGREVEVEPPVDGCPSARMM